jgi:putative glycosyltransferase (TIGR04348 family)
MNIVIITPAAAPALGGNRNTAQRWGRLLRRAGHRVRVQTAWDERPADVLIALHARKSHDTIKRFVSQMRHAPLVVCLTGTDLYRDIRTDASAQESLRLATRIVVLQEMALRELAAEARRKTRVIYQSAKPAKPSTPLRNQFEIAVIGHLREEKDPFRCAMALSYLPQSSRIRVCHMGQAMNAEMKKQALQWMEREPHYRWMGEIPHWQVRERLARCRAMVISSRMEGGANVISEALAARVPVIASQIPGNIGMLGEDYNGYYPVKDERRLALLLQRLETERAFCAALKKQCAARLPLVQEKREAASLEKLLSEIKRR